MQALGERIRTSSIAVVAGILGAFLSTLLDLSDKFSDFTDRLGWTQSEALVLARNTEKSKFSDQLIRSAWKRLYLADRFARRVADGVPKAELYKAWSDYLDSLLSWNTDLMVNIVGLETYYDERKSIAFEVLIQGSIAAADQEVRRLYLSEYAQKMLFSPEPVTATKPEISAVLAATDKARGELYSFVRCFKESDRSQRQC